MLKIYGGTHVGSCTLKYGRSNQNIRLTQRNKQYQDQQSLYHRSLERKLGRETWPKSKLHMEGFRSLREGEPLEFTFQRSPRGLESVHVTGPGGGPCSGSERRQKPKQPIPQQRWKPKGDRCYNCGGLDHHAKECGLPPQPKKCHYCQSATHMLAHCPHRPPGPLSPGHATAIQGRRTTVDQYPSTFTTTSYSPSPRQGNRHSQPSQDSSPPLSKSSSKSSSSPENPAQIQRRSGAHHRWKQS
eukprot:XP_014057006.1 PREDICTED: protein lin-28 homolog B-like isoform X6 [Salmo salar]